jgi:hypothetical protein
MCSFFRYGFFSHHRPFWTELEQETPCFLMKQRHEQGKIFGFHRSMDTRAVLGPMPIHYLYFYPENYTTLFYIAFIPDCRRYPFVKRKKRTVPRKEQPSSRFGLESKSSHVPQSRYRSLAFTLFNSLMFSCCLKPKNQA